MLSETTPIIDNFTSLGAAGLIGAMWLWERRQSNERERQLDDAHTRNMADGVKLEALMDLVKQSTETMATLVHQHDSLLRKLDHEGPD